MQGNLETEPFCMAFYNQTYPSPAVTVPMTGSYGFAQRFCYSQNSVLCIENQYAAAQSLLQAYTQTVNFNQVLSGGQVNLFWCNNNDPASAVLGPDSAIDLLNLAKDCSVPIAMPVWSENTTIYNSGIASSYTGPGGVCADGGSYYISSTSPFPIVSWACCVTEDQARP